MFQNQNSEMTVKISCDALLLKLRDNRAKHAAVFNEARQGYIDKAQKALEVKMCELREGKVSRLYFDLKVPENHLSEYDTVIQMLEWSKDDTIEITMVDFGNFVEDKWQWQKDWLLSNVGYSATARNAVNAHD